MRNFMMSFIFITLSINAAAVDWSGDAELPGNEKCFNSHGHKVCLKDGDRKNIFGLSDAQLKLMLKNGSAHALNYPVNITELKLPKSAMEKFFEADDSSAIRRFIFRIAKNISPFKSFDELFSWVGLHNYPKTMSEYGPNLIPNMGDLEEFPMGVSLFKEGGSESMTFSCAACHSNNLFGTKVLGMTNRFPRANEFFIMGKKVLKNSNSLLFKMLVNPTKEDLENYKVAKKAIKYIDLKRPLTLGLDTSLAQVGLSLALRNKDGYATRPRRPHHISHPLKRNPADSKPAVWWNVKYKTKWLSDASIDSGNPIHTNFLWNEIGRGIDLHKLDKWLANNKKKVQELTSYVFHTEAPKFNDFFPKKINITRAKRGEKLFLNSCKGCHGIYEKGWSAEGLNYEDQIATTKVWYHKKTIYVDVATDPYRHLGMNSFYKDLNRLKISKNLGTVVTPKKGYVPPPLVGIWARWPYFHNNSVPTIYDVLTIENKRPKTFIATPSEDKTLDFDIEKNGYPAPKYIKEPYKTDKKYKFDTSRKGMSNLGHNRMLINEDGSEKFSHEDKIDLIHFLKSL